MISGTLAAQLLKTSRTRGVVMLLLAVAASAAIATAAPGLLAGRKDATHTTIEAAITLGTAIAYLLGVSISAGDRQHGMTRTLLLIQPRRVRYLGSCLAAAAIRLPRRGPDRRHRGSGPPADRVGSQRSR